MNEGLVSLFKFDLVVVEHTCLIDAISDILQCIIYDSGEPNARLIGIEYKIILHLCESLPQKGAAALALICV